MKLNAITNMKTFQNLYFSISIILFVLLLPYLQAVPFCNVGCAPPNSCNSELANQCTACATNFKPVGAYPTSCNFDNTLPGLALVKQTVDFTVSPNPGPTCSNIPYNFGEYGNGVSINVQSAPITISHYQIQLIVYLILFDNWSGGTVDIKLFGTTQNYTVSQTNQIANQKYCFNSNDDNLVRFDRTYTHSDTTSNLKFTITSVITSAGTFGIRDILVIAKSCHPFCKICTGSASTQCTDCNTGSFLSGNQCASNCLAGYGKNLPSNICITCDPLCLTCETNANNCFTCRNIVSGAQIYKVQDKNQCTSTCSAGYFPYLSTTQCLLCTLHCVNMTIAGQVDSSNTFGEFTFTFTDAMNFAGFDHTNFVSFNGSDATLNMATDFTVTYTMIGANTFKLKLTPNPMVYFTGTTFCAITHAQGSTTLQYSANSYKLGPSVYNAHTCITYSTPKVLLTINNQLDTSSKFLEFFYTFSEPMDFVGFDYTDFALLNQSDAILDLTTDFTVVYTQVDTNTFKLTLTPNIGVYFQLTTFCTISNQQALTSLQFSQDFLKLDPTVYEQQNCKIWTILSVNMTITSQVINMGKSAEFVFSFDAAMNFNTFDYTDFLNFVLSFPELNEMDNFTIEYAKVNGNSFKLTITPLQKVQFKNLEFCISSKSRTLTSLQTSSDNIVLNPSVYNQENCLIWSTPQPNIFTPQQQDYYKNLQIFNNHLQQFTTQKGVQQIVKSGVFAFLIPGAQLSTTVLLNRPRIAQNLYEGSRFWGSFVFFDVPPYQKSSTKTKYTFSIPDQQIILNSKTRRLQQITTGVLIDEWKFQRTGHTGYFIIDTYIQLILIAISWILCLIVFIYKRHCQPKASTLWKLKARVMAVFHKIHEFSFFYLVLSGLIEYKNLDTSTYLHILSMIVASVFLFYYLVYELKVFYDLIDYPSVKIGTRQYQKFVQNYGIYLAYYQFEEYNDKKKWNWRHFFRPYNYHVLTFIKKTLMLTAVPIFYDHELWPVILLTAIQGLDVIRFLLTLPYQKFARNLVYFILQALLFIFFLSSLINQVTGWSIYDFEGNIVNTTTATTYKNSGWLGIIVLFSYNILYFLINLVEFGILLFTKSSIENLMWSNRNQYYQELYQHFEQYGSYYRLVKNYTDQLAYNSQRKQVKSFKDWVNRFHGAEPIVDLSDAKIRVFKQIYQRGDLFTTQFSQNMAKDWVDIKIQTFKIKDFQRIIRMSKYHKGLFAPKNFDQNLQSQSNSYSSYKKFESPSYKDSNNNKNMLEYKLDDPMLNFDIQYQIIPQIFVADPIKHKKIKNNLYIPKKVRNTISNKDLNPHFQKNLVMTLISYQTPGTDEITLSTILTINFKEYQQGQTVVYRRQDMRQQISIKSGRVVQKIDLKQVIPGFPIDWMSFQKKKQQQSSAQKQLNNMNSNLLRIQI